VCNSQATQRSVEALWPSARPSVVAYPGRKPLGGRINSEDVRTRAMRAGPLGLVFLGNVIPRKGLFTLLAALARISDLGWHLEIIGDLSVDPAHVRRIRRAVARAGLNRKVVFRGRLDEASLAARLAQSHVMVVPSTHEGFGIAYLDGMGFGLPAVATTAGGAGELVRHGYNGLLVDPGDTRALAHHIAGLIDDRLRLSGISLNALGTYNAHPTWSDSADVVRGFLLGLQNKAIDPSTAGRRSQHLTTAGGSP
jgi:glycosyltransferase involved in cell wall biosynthesis